MKKILISLVLIFSIVLNGMNYTYIHADTAEEPSELHAASACLIDAENGRVLFEKNGYEVRPMASTTKIMTLTIVLEYGKDDDIVGVSKYAASMPDVQLNINSGEQYRLGDLVYAMMLESDNDVAVAIAEYIGEKYLNGSQEDATVLKTREYDVSKKYVSAFASLMNKKAKELGCNDTYFITPNGLDAQDSNGVHATTAVDMARIAAYSIKNTKFVDITNTRSYSFRDLNSKRSFSITNKDAFLSMMDGAMGIKTGFTGDAGYCFVGALKSDGRIFISVVLAAGWPPNKTFKWRDTRQLMSYGTKYFFEKNIFKSIDNYKNVSVKDGITEEVSTRVNGDVSLLLSDNEHVKIVYEFPEYVNAPVELNEEVGNVKIYIDGELYETLPITATSTSDRIDYKWCLLKIIKTFMP